MRLAPPGPGDSNRVEKKAVVGYARRDGPAGLLQFWRYTMLERALAVGICLTLITGCPGGDGESENEGNTASPEGALSCDTTPVECRTAFADAYEGVYAGPSTGRVILDIDVLGGIVGTVTKVDGSSVAVMGKVDEFGQVTFKTDDGTEWTGQFTKDQQLTGTFTTSDAMNGTFVAASTTPALGPPGPTGSSTAAEPSVDTGGDTGSDTPAPPVSAPSGTIDGPALLAKAKLACAATEACPDFGSDCATLEEQGEAGLGPVECRNLEAALYDCMVTNKCDSQTACNAQVSPLITCTFGGEAAGAPLPAMLRP
jgi:hypothetical protein